MEKKETINFMQRIKSHYQEFVIDDFKIEEWHKELKKYDYEDVNKKLEEHLSSETFGEQIPKLYFLTKYLIPTEDKGKIRHYTVVCQLCGKEVADTEFDDHFIRCSAAQAIVRDLRKYFNLTVDYQQLMSMSSQRFEEVYVKYLNKMLDAKIPRNRMKIILRCLYPDEKTDINELLKDMDFNE